MREIRLSGSEGGGPKPIASPYPYLTLGRLGDETGEGVIWFCFEWE